jgi:RNA polymerase sigma-70 factor (ECF subfamily)
MRNVAGQARVGAADQDELADMFSQARPRLVRVAYAILGSHSEAEDVVADCWLRLVAADRAASVRDVEAWAIMTVPRMALDVLRSARVRREQYVGPWLPEPLVGTVYAEPAAGSWAGLGASARMAADPADKVTLDDQVSYALLVVLETLTPAERTAFVLHDLFGLQFDEVAAVVGRSPGAARQLASRARRHVRTRGTPPPVDAAEHRKVVSAFAVAVTSGDLTALIQLLDPEVVLISDGGGMVSSARRPVTGADRVARFLLGIVAKAGPRDYLQPVAVNGSPGFAVYQAGRLVTVVSLTLAGERVARVDMVRAPGKLPKATCSDAPLPRATLVPHASVIDDGSR